MGPQRRALRVRARAALGAAIALLALLPGVAVAERKGPSGSTGSSAGGATVATGSPTKPCGTRTFKKADGSPYRCSWSDEFAGSRLDPARWTTVRTEANGQRTGYECLLDSPDAVAVANNILSLTTRRLDEPMTCASPYGDFATSYTGAMVTSWGTFSQAYGRFEIRARFPKTNVPGLQASLWLYPRVLSYGAWPASGEIDVAEWFSGWSDRVIPFLHYRGDGADPYRTNRSCLVADTSDFHRYALEWTPTSITVTYDGAVCLRNVRWIPEGLAMPAPFDKPFVVILAQGIGMNANAPTDATPFPATTQVDYVRVWS